MIYFFILYIQFLYHGRVAFIHVTNIENMIYKISSSRK